MHGTECSCTGSYELWPLLVVPFVLQSFRSLYPIFRRPPPLHTSTYVLAAHDYSVHQDFLKTFSMEIRVKCSSQFSLADSSLLAFWQVELYKFNCDTFFLPSAFTHWTKIILHNTFLSKASRISVYFVSAHVSVVYTRTCLISVL